MGNLKKSTMVGLMEAFNATSRLIQKMINNQELIFEIADGGLKIDNEAPHLFSAYLSFETYSVTHDNESSNEEVGMFLNMVFGLIYAAYHGPKTNEDAFYKIKWMQFQTLQQNYNKVLYDSHSPEETSVNLLNEFFYRYCNIPYEGLPLSLKAQRISFLAHFKGLLKFMKKVK